MKLSVFFISGIAKLQKHAATHFRIWLLVSMLLLLAFAEYLPEGIRLVLQGTDSLQSIFRNMVSLIWMSFPFYLAICAPVTLLPPRGIRIYLAILLPVVSGITLLHIFLLSCFRIALGRGLLYVLFDTGKEEVAEYLGEHLQPSPILIFLLFTAIAAAITVSALRLNWKQEKRSFFLCILLLGPLLVSATRFIVIGEPTAILYRVSSLRIIADFLALISEQDRFYQAAAIAPQLPEDIRPVAPGLSNLLGIIAIGESATRSHHGLYGYSRDTTPFQSGRSDLMVFNRVFSAAPLTGVSLKYALTFATLHKPDEYRCTLVSILKKSGIRTVWLSAQGERCSTDSLLFHGADRVLYSPADTCDDALAEMLPQALAGWERSPVVILLHLNGSHSDYSRRYPKQQQRFTDLPPEPAHLSAEEIESVNHYDNSIAFTDSILKKLIGFLETTERPSFLLYFSDHGEAPARNGRNNIRNPKVTAPIFYEIPFWVWASRQYHTIRPGFAENARGNRDKPMQLDRGGIYALCDIAGIRYRNFPEEANIFSASFRSQPIYFLGTVFSASSIPAEEVKLPVVFSSPPDYIIPRRNTDGTMAHAPRR